jgi:hypothetical protein
MAEYAEQYEDRQHRSVDVNPWRVIRNARINKNKVVVNEVTRVVTFLDKRVRMGVEEK